MATGREWLVELPEGKPQPRRLLDVIDRVPGMDPDNPERWLMGLTWQPWQQCRALTAEADTECSVVLLEVTPQECPAAVTQTPFRISDAYKGSTLDTTSDTTAEILVSRYNLQISASFASELLSGAASGGRALSKSATAPNDYAFGVGAVHIYNAFARLEEELAERLQGQVGYLHVPPGMLAKAKVFYGVELNAEGQWETAAGNIVISDAGYCVPTPPTGQAAAGVGNDWLYASGPVYFESTSPILVGVGSDTFDRTRNTLRQYIDGFGILVFDPCPVTAILATYLEP